MKHLLLASLFLNLTLVLSGQTIQGRVLDAETKEPIPLASVFFDGTFAGTSTDEKGNFKLDASKYISRPLTISAMGYSPYSLENLDPGKSYSVLLARDLYEIEEVSIIGNDIAEKRKAYMRIFKSEFIGLTTNARRCYIMNEEDITFNYNSDQDTLRARALKPIEIHNDALGYHLEYHLESFEFVKETQKVSYQGSIVFTFDLAWEGYRSKVFKRRRRFAYTGSGKEFIRKLWQNSLKSSGYSIRNYSTGEALKYEDVVFQDSLGSKNLKYPGTLEILYYNYFSRISFLKEEAFIDQDGFFDPTAILWSGKMGYQRIADFLPYEYSFDR
jgi:hypothetical protein